MRRDQLSSERASDVRPPIIELRIPGPWQSPVEFEQALREAGAAYDVSPEAGGTPPQLVHIPTGMRFDLGVSPHDDEIADLFAYGGRLSPDEVRKIHAHAVKVHLIAPGGSVEAARATMDAAAAIIRAGGTGVFVDNCGNAHGVEDWLALANDTKPGGLYWAFVAATAGQGEVFSTGMHCLGLRDAEIQGIEDVEYAGFLLHNFLGYTYQSGIEVHDGDPIGDESGPTMRVRALPCTRYRQDTPFHNPYGIWRLEPIEKDSDRGDTGS